MPSTETGERISDRDAVVTSWGADGFFFTEAARGGSLPWRVGGSKLEGDALGPVRHAHDDAAEYYFMFSGSAHVETGGEEFVLEEGQLGCIPPDAPHNFLGPASDKDACLFCVVGPNLTYNKWRVKDFKPESESLRMAVSEAVRGRRAPRWRHAVGSGGRPRPGRCAQRGRPGRVRDHLHAGRRFDADQSPWRA